MTSACPVCDGHDRRHLVDNASFCMRCGAVCSVSGALPPQPDSVAIAGQRIGALRPWVNTTGRYLEPTPTRFRLELMDIGFTVDEKPDGCLYDGIFGFHTLDATTDPHAFVESLLPHLSPNGFLALEVTDIFEALRRPHHTHRPVQFHLHTLTYLLARHRLAVQTTTQSRRVRPHHLLCVARRQPARATLPSAELVAQWWDRMSRSVKPRRQRSAQH